VLGVTAGYIGSNLKLRNAPFRSDYQAANIGIYGRLNFGPAFVNGLIKYEKYWVDVDDRTRGLAGEADGDGYGGWIEAGVRFGGDRFFVEPTVSLESAKIDLDGFTTLGTDFALDEANGIRGKAGARVGAVLGNGPSRIVGYAKAQVIHEFEGKDRLFLTNAGGTLAFDNPRTDTYGRATVGVDIAMRGGVRGFMEASADFANGVSGGGARGGLSIPF
jgi:outer membrane autotransporter protein